MNQPLFQVEQLEKRFGNKEVLRGIDLTLEPGEVLGLLGANGSGKTTLIKCALGLLRPTAGRVTIFGENAWDLSAAAKARLKRLWIPMGACLLGAFLILLAFGPLAKSYLHLPSYSEYILVALGFVGAVCLLALRAALQGMQRFFFLGLSMAGEGLGRAGCGALLVAGGVSGGLGALFGRSAIDEALYEELETALLMADCGVSATRTLLSRLRERARRERIAEPQGLKRALQEELKALLAPLEKPLDLSRARPIVVMIAGVNGSGKTTSIGKLAKWLQGQGLSVLLAAGARPYWEG